MKLMVSIVPKKFNDAVSAIIGKYGIDSQTTVTGEGTATSEILECFSLEATDKQVVFSLVDDADVQTVLNALNEKLDFSRSGAGGVFTLAVSGLSEIGCSLIQSGTTKE